MLPALSVAVGNATPLRVSPRLPAETVTGEGHVRQSWGAVAHVHRGGAAEGCAPVRSNGPALDLTFYGDVLRRPQGEVPRSTAWNSPMPEPS